MKKNLLTSLMVLTIALSLSINAFAQEAKVEGGKPGPWKENAESGDNQSGNGTIPVGGTTVYDPITGMLITDPTSWTPTSVGDADCDPLTDGWDACLKTTKGSVMIGGDQGSKMEKAYGDTQTTSGSDTDTSETGEGLDKNKTVD